MRIIGGSWKGRRIQQPSKKWPVRPTTDFAREALFNILDNRVEYQYLRALDLFGGTGIHSLELYSRGCTDITYVDRNKASAQWMREFAMEWSLPITVVQQEVFSFLRNTQQNWEYVFADPPYDMPGIEDLPGVLIQSGILSPGGLIVLEHSNQRKLVPVPEFLESRHYGQSVFSFFTAGS